MFITRRSLIAIPVSAALAANDRNTNAEGFHHENILGTSLDLIVYAKDAECARGAEAATLGEIARLDAILSTYRPDSEISRLNQSIGAMKCSVELFALLDLYRRWGKLSGGALSATPRSRDALVLDRAFRTALRGKGAVVNVDALGKAFILDRAAAVGLAQPGVSHLMLDIGGDIVFTEAPSNWIAGIADPARPHENAAPLTQVALRQGAVAASGSYARGAHIIDARSGQSAGTARSATAIGPDAVTANALATALCVLKPGEGIALANSIPGTEAMVIEVGVQYRSAAFADLERPVFRAVQVKTAWTEGYEVAINVTLKSPDGGRGFKRPYVAIWAEDASGKTVRTIALWMSRPRWIRDLDAWYRSNEYTNWNAIARATRSPGKYRVVWDGLDDGGKPVPKGNYSILVESNREHGNYAKESATIDCGQKKASATMKDTSEFEAVSIQFGPHVDQA